MTYVNDEIFERRPYDDYPYLVLNRKNYKVKLGNTLPTIRAFVYQKDNLFGDATPYNLAGIDIRFRLYNSSRKVVASGIASVSDLTISEIEYKLKKMDIVESGEYYGEFIFKDINNETFVLPTPDERARIYLIIL